MKKEGVEVNEEQFDIGFIKHTNKKNVLSSIKQNHGISRAEIAQLLSLSKPTTSKIVNELIAEGWIREEWRVEKNALGGRRPLALFFNEKSQYIIGIDIGGTNVELAIVNLYGKVLDKKTFLTQKYVANHLIEKLIDSINQLINKQNLTEKQILGVGIGVPGITDFKKGVILDAPTLGWKNYPLKQVLSERIPFPIYIDNDVNVSVLGERWRGAAKNKRNILKVMLGTGVGCGMILNGELYRGASYAAGEIGYMVTDKTTLEKGYTSVFEGYGFLDNHVGGSAIAKQMTKESGTNTIQKKPMTAFQVFNLASKKNAQAEKVVEEMIQHVSIAIMNVIAMVNPECIVIGGGVSKSLRPYLPKIKAMIREYLPIECEILFSQHEDVSVIGAANLLLVEHDSIFKC